MRRTIEERFWPKVNRAADDECWVWEAAIHTSGYGAIGEGGKHGRMLMAHRVAYELLVGPIPVGLELDHLCRNRRCVNPSHLEPVTSSENKLRSPLVGRVWQVHGAIAAAKVRNGRATCPNGHPWDEQNTYQRPGKGNGRTCRACNREARRRYLDRMIEVRP